MLVDAGATDDELGFGSGLDVDEGSVVVIGCALNSSGLETDGAEEEEGGAGAASEEGFVAGVEAGAELGVEDSAFEDSVVVTEMADEVDAAGSETAVMVTTRVTIS